MEIKFFNLLKAGEKSKPNQPDYRVSFRDDDTFFEAGACWIKQDKNGKNFLSCKLNDPWKDHTDDMKSKKGWHIEEDRALTVAEAVKKARANQVEDL